MIFAEMGVVGAVMFAVVCVGGIVFFWWCDRAQAAAEAIDNAELAEAIKHLPVEKQAEIWMAKLRDDVRRDTP